jgi:hypothetical protein
MLREARDRQSRNLGSELHAFELLTITTTTTLLLLTISRIIIAICPIPNYPRAPKTAKSTYKSTARHYGIRG